MHAKRWNLASSAAALVAMATLGSPIASVPASAASTTAGTWTTVSPAKAGSGGFLNDVDCSSPTSCMAVGASFTMSSSSLNATPVAQRFDGSGWTSLPVPFVGGKGTIGMLGSISCPSANSCVAVGFSTGSLVTADPATPLAYSFDGSSWSPTTIASHEGYNVTLNDVSCPADGSCIAVGMEQQVNGNGAGQPIVDRLDHGTWTQLATPPVPAGKGIYSGIQVSCTSTTSCLALYDLRSTTPTAINGREVAATFDGTTWTKTAAVLPKGSNIYANALSCASATSCVAAAQSVPRNARDLQTGLLLSFDGTTWTSLPVAQLAKLDGLDGVDCFAPGSCMATGMTPDLQGTARLLGQGRAKTAGTTTTSSGLVSTAVSCSSASSCLMVGSRLGNGLTTQWVAAAFTAAS